MYVKQIELVNFQTIKEFSQSFEGNVYFVTGENELGKSTLLKAIAILLTGNRDEVLKNGEEKGFAKAIIGNDGNEYEVELRFTKANPRGTLTIKDQASGLRSDRISALQEIFGYQDFDANEFSHWSETAEGRRKQVDIVKSLLPEKVQTRIIEIDNEIEKTKAARKDDNAELKVFSNIVKAKQKEVTEKDEQEFAEPLEVEELREQKTKAAAINEQIKGVKQRLADRQKELELLPGKISDIENETKKQHNEYNIEEKEAKEEYERKLAAIKSKRKKLDEQAKQQKDEIEAQKTDLEDKTTKAENYLKKNQPVPLDEIQEKIDKADEHNKKNGKVKELKEARSNADKTTKKIDKHNEKITTLTTEREKLIKDSKLPVKGLNFSDDGLILNDVPFAPGKVSSSQEMEIATKLIIAKNPKVKVFRIARGESLGANRLKELVNFAKENGYQGFIEQVVRAQNQLIVEEFKEK